MMFVSHSVRALFSILLLVGSFTLTTSATAVDAHVDNQQMLAPQVSEVTSIMA